MSIKRTRPRTEAGADFVQSAQSFRVAKSEPLRAGWKRRTDFFQKTDAFLGIDFFNLIEELALIPVIVLGILGKDRQVMRLEIIQRYVRLRSLQMTFRATNGTQPKQVAPLGIEVGVQDVVS